MVIDDQNISIKIQLGANIRFFQPPNANQLNERGIMIVKITINPKNKNI